MLITRDRNQMKSNFRNNSLGYFQFYHSVLGRKLVFSIILSITVGVLDSVGLAMMIPLLQSVSGGGTSNNESLGYLSYFLSFLKNLGLTLNLPTVLGIMVIVFAVKGVAKYLDLRYQAIIGPYFMKRVRYKLVEGLKNISYKGFLEMDAGSLQNGFIAEVQRMSQALKYYFAYTQGAIMLATYVLFAMLVNFQFAILLSISAGLTNLLYSRIYKKMKVASAEISKKGDDINEYMIQAVHYFKYLKSTNYLNIYAKKLSAVIGKNEELNKKVGFYSAITMGVREPMIILIVVGVIYVQVQLMGGSLAPIILSLILFYRALTFLLIIQQNWQNFLQFTGSLQNVSSMSARISNAKEQDGDKIFDSMSGDISLVDVDISFGGRKVLHKANINIPRKQTIAFVGESGSGKTTLANIIMGLIPPDHGEVLIGDQDIREYNLGTYRSKIGYISQESVIFNESIYNNITFWAEPTSQNLNRFRNVLHAASLLDFVEALPKREHTILGNNGITISGGQKQRISIAREMFKNVELLILDEATSALDSETESVIQENIEKLHGQYTMIVIAHRLSTIKNVDKIYLIDKGNVVVSGNFENMIANSEKFKRMVALQGL
jgi:ABC-type multidrug transport system fused ATPase/permease subunit